MTTKKATVLPTFIFTKVFSGISASWRYCFAIWAASRLFLFGWGLLLWALGFVSHFMGKSFYFDIQPITDGIAAPLWGIWLRWDAVNYLRLAQNGIHENDLSGFFPLFPLLGRWTSFLFNGNTLASLIAISNLALLFAMILLYKIVEEDYSLQTARNTVLIMVSFPGAIFFYAAYPHSLALALVLGAYWSARHSRWPLAFLLGCLSGLAHPTALPVFFLLGYLVYVEFRKKITWPRLTLAFVPFSALAGSGIYMAWRAGAGFPSYGELCSQFWGISVIFPWQYYQEIGKLFTNVHFLTIGWINLLVCVLVVFLLIYGRRKIRWEAWFYQVSMLVYYLSFTSTLEPLTGFTRLTIMMFPQFIESGMLMSSKWTRVILFFVFWILQLWLLFMFFAWVWVG